MKENVKFIARWLGVLILIGFLVGCQNQQKQTAKLKKETIITAKLHTPVVPLYYNGVLAPIQLILVLSPVNGRIADLNFKYGEFVVQGQSLLVIDSAKLTQNFRKSITDYLQKKGAFANSAEKFQGTEALYRAGVISREEYLTGKNQYQTAQLNFFQSQFAMEKVLKLAGVDIPGIERLTLADKEEITKILKRQFKHIVIRAKGSGIALFPLKSSQGSDNGAKLLNVGHQVKQNQLLLSIGNLSGLSAKIDVSEVNINRIKKGMSAIVTSSAFPGITLHGQVSNVSSQAHTSQGGSGSSMFTVLVKIPKLAKKYKKIIRVGMTAKIEIDIKKHPVIMVPIAAVFQKGGGAAVTIIDKKGKRRVVSVVTSFTTSKEVAIVQGIKKGDRVVVPGKTEAQK